MKVMIATLAMLALSSPALAQPAHDMSKMGAMDQMATPASAQGSGVIKKIDAKSGSVTLDHGPIAELKWPAMTMAFKAAPNLLQGLKVGQKVTFTVKTGGAASEITSIQPS